jgi:hypothetical protein
MVISILLGVSLGMVFPERLLITSASRRPGQVETCYAAADDATGALELLSLVGWQVELAWPAAWSRRNDIAQELRIAVRLAPGT